MILKILTCSVLFVALLVGLIGLALVFTGLHILAGAICIAVAFLVAGIVLDIF